MLTYEFTITLSGSGDNEAEAWEDAIDHFCDDPGDAEGTLTSYDGDEDDEFVGHD